MKIIITKVVGADSYTFEISDPQDLVALSLAGDLASMPDKCSLCDGEVTLASNKSTSEKGTFTFVYMRCKGCGAKAQLGQYKGGGFFWKKFEKYEGKSGTPDIDENGNPV